MLCPNGALDRFPGQIEATNWHLLIADEALRYANPATQAHQALRRVRLSCAADCWLLTATPRGKSAEHLDVLVGLALGDEAMIRERLNTREAGDLMDELNAHRLRVNYGPHLVRVTRQDLATWMPDVRPAQPLANDPDPALQELLEAIRQGARAAYRPLLQLQRELQTLEGGTPLDKPALETLRRKRHGEIGFTRTGRSDSEHEIGLFERTNVRRLRLRPRLHDAPSRRDLTLRRVGRTGRTVFMPHVPDETVEFCRPMSATGISSSELATVAHA